MIAFVAKPGVMPQRLEQFQINACSQPHLVRRRQFVVYFLQPLNGGSHHGVINLVNINWTTDGSQHCDRQTTAEVLSIPRVLPRRSTSWGIVPEVNSELCHAMATATCRAQENQTRDE